MMWLTCITVIPQKISKKKIIYRKIHCPTFPNLLIDFLQPFSMIFQPSCCSWRGPWTSSSIPRCSWTSRPKEPGDPQRLRMTAGICGERFMEVVHCETRFVSRMMMMMMMMMMRMMMDPCVAVTHDQERWAWTIDCAWCSPSDAALPPIFRSPNFGLGTLAFTTCKLLRVPSSLTMPRRLLRSPMMLPMYSSGVITSTFSSWQSWKALKDV